MKNQDLENELDLLHQRICPALGDPKRMQILYLLEDKARNVTEITELMDMPQSSVSRHLAVLRERGIVATERQGTSIFYSLTDVRIVGAINLLRQVLRNQLDEQVNLIQVISDSPGPQAG
jgi:ArsR family transcriptional regulator